MAVECSLQPLVNLGHGLPEHLADKIEGGARFVGDRRLAGAGAVGQPDRSDFVVQRGVLLFAFGGKEVFTFQIAHDAFDPLDHGKHGAPARLGGVGSEHKLDGQLLHQAGHLLGADPRFLEAYDRIFDRIVDRQWVIGKSFAAQAFQAVEVLRRIDQVKVEGKGAGDDARRASTQALHLSRHFRGGPARFVRLIAAPRFGQRADALLHVEQGVRLLFNQHAPQRVPQQANGFGKIHRDKYTIIHPLLIIFGGAIPRLS